MGKALSLIPYPVAVASVMVAFALASYFVCRLVDRIGR